MLERSCNHCRQRYFAARRSSLFCSGKCRVANKRKRDNQAKRERAELRDYGNAAKNAIYAIAGIGELKAEELRARGTLKQVWITASEQLLMLGVTRDELRQLLIK